MAENLERKSLGEYKQELMFETLDLILDKRGQTTNTDERKWGATVTGLPLEIRRYIEDAYIVGYRDAIARVVYASEIYEHKSPIARRLSRSIEKIFQDRTKHLEVATETEGGKGE